MSTGGHSCSGVSLLFFLLKVLHLCRLKQIPMRKYSVRDIFETAWKAERITGRSESVSIHSLASHFLQSVRGAPSFFRTIVDVVHRLFLARAPGLRLYLTNKVKNEDGVIRRHWERLLRSTLAVLQHLNEILFCDHTDVHDLDGMPLANGVDVVSHLYSDLLPINQEKSDRLGISLAI